MTCTNPLSFTAVMWRKLEDTKRGQGCVCPDNSIDSDLKPDRQAHLAPCRKLDEREQAWWALDMVHLLYSAGVSATVLLRGRASWLSVAAPPAGAQALLPDVIVCVSAGFFAFHLWALVHHRRGLGRSREPAVGRRA